MIGIVIYVRDTKKFMTDPAKPACALVDLTRPHDAGLPLRSKSNKGKTTIYWLLLYKYEVSITDYPCKKIP
jgi:hypothetical protein